MIEHWLPVPDYEGIYEVSDLGRVRSLDRYVESHDGRRWFKQGLIKRQNPTAPTGYLAVGLARDGRKVTKRVHVLVLQAFVGPRPDGMEACHGPGGMYVNALANLRWDTKSANSQDTIQAGNHNHARKTECIRGHDLSVHAYIKRSDGGRQCRLCDNANRRAKYAARKAA